MSPEAILAFPIAKFPIVKPHDNLVKLILEAEKNSKRRLKDGDIIVIASKIVSVSESRVVNSEVVAPSLKAREIASKNGFDPIHVELAIRESTEIIQTDGVLITETHSGLVCNFSGVDKSNAPEGKYILLPEDPDASAQRLQDALSKATGKKLAIIISDTQGRPWRNGSLNVAIGCAGIAPFKYNKGKRDLYGRVLKRSTVCQIDEIAMLAEPLLGQAGQRTPVVIVRGYSYTDSEESAKDINRPKDEDMFR
ncbi:coenzyme F420-0:L-glutamate ligase [Candidatus Thorarchaeota archaeon]|nr:MAG: coenzyme F420-0:L-glutamate ligase [Candidatus Thorarchaeota archaeon]